MQTAPAIGPQSVVRHESIFENGQRDEACEPEHTGEEVEDEDGVFVEVAAWGFSGCGVRKGGVEG